MKNKYFQASNVQNLYSGSFVHDIVSKPARRSNPIPTAPDEEEEPLIPGKEDPSKKKKKKSIYEVTY